MEQQNAINPDIVCGNALNARMASYRADEAAVAAKKNYNDGVDGLVQVIQLMKNRILELEKELEKEKKKG